LIGPEHERFAGDQKQTFGQTWPLAGELAALDLDRARHEEIEQAALAARGILHADLHAREHVVTGRAAAARYQVGGDLAQIAQHGLLPFRKVDGEAHQDRGANGEHEIADPG